MPADTSDVPPLHSVALFTLGRKLSGFGTKIRKRSGRSRFNARRKSSSNAGFSISLSGISTQCALSGCLHRKVSAEPPLQFLPCWDRNAGLAPSLALALTLSSETLDTTDSLTLKANE